MSIAFASRGRLLAKKFAHNGKILGTLFLEYAPLVRQIHKSRIERFENLNARAHDYYEGICELSEGMRNGLAKLGKKKRVIIWEGINAKASAPYARWAKEVMRLNPETEIRVSNELNFVLSTILLDPDNIRETKKITEELRPRIERSVVLFKLLVPDSPNAKSHDRMETLADTLDMAGIAENGETALISPVKALKAWILDGAQNELSSDMKKRLGSLSSKGKEIVWGKISQAEFYLFGRWLQDYNALNPASVLTLNLETHEFEGSAIPMEMRNFEKTMKGVEGIGQTLAKTEGIMLAMWPAGWPKGSALKKHNRHDIVFGVRHNLGIIKSIGSGNAMKSGLLADTIGLAEKLNLWIEDDRQSEMPPALSEELTGITKEGVRNATWRPVNLSTVGIVGRWLEEIKELNPGIEVWVDKNNEIKAHLMPLEERNLEKTKEICLAVLDRVAKARDVFVILWGKDGPEKGKHINHYRKNLVTGVPLESIERRGREKSISLGLLADTYGLVDELKELIEAGAKTQKDLPEGFLARLAKLNMGQKSFVRDRIMPLDLEILG